MEDIFLIESTSTMLSKSWENNLFLVVPRLCVGYDRKGRNRYKFKQRNRFKGQQNQKYDALKVGQMEVAANNILTVDQY